MNQFQGRYSIAILLLVLALILASAANGIAFGAGNPGGWP